MSQLEINILVATLLDYPWTETLDAPKLTGIPPHICIMAEVEQLKNEIKNLRDTLIKDIKNELTERGIGGSDYFTKIILDQMNAKFMTLSEQVQKIYTPPTDSSFEVDQAVNEDIGWNMQDEGNFFEEIPNKEQFSPEELRAKEADEHRKSAFHVKKRVFEVGM